MPTKETRQSIEAELNEGESPRLMRQLKVAIAQIEEMEWLLKRAETPLRKLNWRNNEPLSTRLARVGVSAAAVTQVDNLFDYLEKLRDGKPLPPEGARLLGGLEAAGQSAFDQLVAIVHRRRR